MNTAEIARVLLIDDHPVVRHGLRQLIDLEHDLEVCGEAGTLQEGLAAIQELGPDLAIVDVALGDSDGLEVVRQCRARWPGVFLLVLSMLGERLHAERALQAGAHGYIMKQEAADVLLTAVRRVLGGGVYINPDLQELWLRRAIGNRSAALELPITSLTDRELTVLRLIGQGLSTRRVAEELNLSVKTVESHRDNVRQKLALENSAELIRYAALWSARSAGGD